MGWEDNKQVTEVEYEDFKGFPIITLPLANGKGFSFGFNKAKAILKYYQEISDWVEKNTQR